MIFYKLIDWYNKDNSILLEKWFSTSFNALDYFLTFVEEDKEYSLGLSKAEILDYLTFQHGESYLYIDVENTDLNTMFNRMITKISIFFNTNSYTYKTLIKSMFQKYNMIENYNMNEELAEVEKNATEIQTTTPTGSTVVEHNEQGNVDTLKKTDSTTYENNTYKPKTQENITITPNTTNITTTSIGEGTRTEIKKEYQTESVDFDNVSFDYGTKALHHKINRHGNIGVTTSQQMIESERKLAKINILEMIISDLKSLMLLNVY